MVTEQVESFDIPPEIAEAYEARFVPRLFSRWAVRLADAASIGPGDRVLDVATGTGVVAREVAGRLEGGTVVGLDLNESMLAVARRTAPGIEWRRGDAQALPFEDAAFDAVLCQAALMFFPDLGRAIAEMRRVVRPDGRVVLQVWAAIGEQPAYGPFVELAARLVGPEALTLLGTYWSLGDLVALRGAIEAAGLRVVDTVSLTEVAEFDSIEELVRIEVESTPLVERIDRATYDALIERSRDELSRFETVGGARVPVVGHIVTARPG